jgi:peroxiredoxin
MRALLLLAAVACWAQTIKTGPAVGERIPSFRLTDQHGREQTLETLRGPNGLVLAFVRSADW